MGDGRRDINKIKAENYRIRQNRRYNILVGAPDLQTNEASPISFVCMDRLAKEDSKQARKAMEANAFFIDSFGYGEE